MDPMSRVVALLALKIGLGGVLASTYIMVSTTLTASHVAHPAIEGYQVVQSEFGDYASVDPQCSPGETLFCAKPEAR
jgi:hypothetical protein